MGSKKSSSPAPPATPQQKDEYTYLNGRLVSSRTMDKSKNAFVDNTYLTPEEQSAYDQGVKGYADLLGKVPGAIATTDEERLKFADELYQPQARRLTDSFNRTLGEATGAAGSRGVLKSLGFADYATKQLDKNYQQGLSDLYNQATLQSYQLPQLKLDPIISGLSVYDTSINSPTQRALSLLDPSFQGSQAATNAALQQFNAEQQRYAMMNQNKSKGFFGSLFG